MRHNILALLIIMLLSNGCMIRYGTAIGGAQVTPLVTSPAADKQHNMKSIDFNNGQTYYAHEYNYSVRYRNVRLTSTKHSDFNFGYQLFGGQYSVAKLDDYRDQYSFFGGGFEVKGCGYFSLSSLDIGIGFHMQQVIEIGDYYRFRKDTDKLDNVENDTSLFIPMFSISPLLRFNIDETSSIGFQTAIGFPQLISPVIWYQNSSYVYWTSWSPPFHSDNDNQPVFSIGLGLIR